MIFPYQPKNIMPNFASCPLIKKLLKKKKQIQNISFSPKILKKGLFITKANIPQNMKDNLIHNLVINSKPQIHVINEGQNPQTSHPDQANKKKNPNKTYNQRVLFKKEEDEKIMNLVKIFGTKHWDIVAQFIEGRTAKQCRDHYSNYLIPGFFQGEWSEEEDSLLIELYKKYGPRWSIIQKSFKNRSSNNIKNRWYYFLHKKTKIFNEKVLQEFETNESERDAKQNSEQQHNSEIDNRFEEYQETKLEKEDNDDNLTIFQHENDFFESFNNSCFDFENDSILFNQL